MKRLKSICEPYRLSLAFVAVAFGVMYFLMPNLLDDVAFGKPMTDFMKQPSVDNFFSGLWQSTVWRFMEDNGRIPNLFGSAFVVVPRYILGPLMGLSVAYCLWLGSRLAGVWRRNHMLYSVLAFLLVFVLPWADFMFGIMFWLNYVVATAIFLTVLELFLKGRLTTWYGALLAGLLVSCWHEMFGGALFCGVCAAWLFDRRYRTKTTYYLIAGLLAGVIYLYLVPGRACRVEDAVLFIGLLHPLDSAAYGVVFYAFVVLSVIAFACRRQRSVLPVTLILIYLAMAAGAWLIWRTFMFGLRTSWLMTVISSIGLVLTLAHLPWRFMWNRKLVAVVSVLLWLLIVAELAACLPYFVRMHKEVEEMDALLAEKADGPVWYDYTTADQVPAYLLNKPNFNAYLLWLCQYDRVLPTALRDFEPSAAEDIGEGCTAYKYGDCIVIPFQDDYKWLESHMRLWHGSIANRYNLVLEPFVGKDGERYIYCAPRQRTRAERGRPVTMVSIE